MVLGFNHNIRYKGELFHVQTEDSGRANPHIITLLYRGGTILASAKTSYADIIKVDQLELVVESIMKDQHKAMMRRLKAGEFDARIFGAAPAADGPRQASAEADRESGAKAPAEQEAPVRKDPAIPEAASVTEPEPAIRAASANQPAAAIRAASANQLAAAIQAASANAAAVRAPSQPASASHQASGSQSFYKTPSPSNPPASPTKRSLDEVILDYLITGEEK